MPGVGVTKPISSILLFSEFWSIVKTHVRYWILCWYLTRLTASPVKYECDSKNVKSTFARSKFFLLTENLTNGAIVTPTPDVLQDYVPKDQCAEGPPPQWPGANKENCNSTQDQASFCWHEIRYLFVVVITSICPLSQAHFRSTRIMNVCHQCYPFNHYVWARHSHITWGHYQLYATGSWLFIGITGTGRYWI